MLLRWLLLLLQMLLLLRMFCLHLLRLLRVLLLHLLVSGFVSLLLGRLLVLLLLLLLEFLVVLLLLRVKLVLLLLVFLIRFGVSRVWCRRTFVWLNILGVRWSGRPRNIVVLRMASRFVTSGSRNVVLRPTSRFVISRPRNIVLRTTSLPVACWWMIRRSRLSCRHGPCALEFSGSRSGCDRGPALVHRCPLLWVVARSFFMLSLSSYRRNVLLPLYRFLLRRSTRRDSTVAAVVADAVDCRVIDHGGVVNVVNIGDIDIVY